MNIEFNPKSNSKIDGLTVASGIKRSNLETKGLVEPKGLNEGSIRFKDLLDQTKNGKNQLPMQQAVLSVKNPQELMPDEKLTGTEIDENIKDRFKEISENNLMSLLQSSPNMFLTSMNNTRTGINFGSGNPSPNTGIDDVSQLTSQLVENTNNPSQVDQLFVGTNESGQKIKSPGIEGEDSSVSNTGTKSSEIIIGEVDLALSAKTGTDQKVISPEGEAVIKQTQQSPEPAKPIAGAVDPILSAKTGTDQKVIAPEGEAVIKQTQQPPESAKPIAGAVDPTLSAKTGTDQKVIAPEGEAVIKQTQQPPEPAKPIAGAVDPTLSAKTGTDQKVIASEGEAVIKQTRQTPEPAKPIPGAIDPTLSAKTGTDQKAIGSEDQKDVTQTEMEEVPLLNTFPVKNAEILTIDKVDLSAQIEQEIIFQLDKNKPMTFQMKLDPENLGEIDVQLKFEQGKLVIDIMAFSKETQALLLGQIDKLIKNLALQNVQVESVHLNNQSQNNYDSNSQASMMNMGMDFSQNQKQSLLKEDARADNDQKLKLGLGENDQRLKHTDYRINVLV
ncbi:flagellar hook-length control protein FliK [Acetobacterium sp.]|uniref:flagellar hook-length control protein FliK n=1 Tax=Acetobacterium sp. TaxID=1872094 RepID=UPI002F3F3F87